MRHLFSPDKTRVTIKQTNLYKSAIRHKFAIGAVTVVSGLAAIAMTTLPALTNVSAVDGDVDNNTSNQQVIPYGGKIGFIGDSLTHGATYSSNQITYNMPSHSTIDSLGGTSSGWYSQTFGVDGPQSSSWCNPQYLADPKADLAKSIAAFSGGNIKVLSIMLGTNDANLGVSPSQYKDNMSKVIDIYRNEAGVEKIILNQIPYSIKHDNNLTTAYNKEIFSLADGKTVFVGDTQIYDYTKTNKDSIFSDNAGVHLTKAGYDKLGQFWAEAYKRVLLDPQTINHVTVVNGNTVSYAISKDSSWFKPDAGYFSNVLVDNRIIDVADYTVTGDNNNTKIVLNADYVKTLDKTVKHTISIRFNDGVNFSDEFELKADDNTSNNNQGGGDNADNQNQDGGNHQNAGVTQSTAIDKVTIAAPNTGYRK